MGNCNTIGLNSSVARDVGRESTPVNNVININDWIQKHNASLFSDGSHSSTPLLPRRPVSDEEKTQFTDEIISKERQYDQLMAQVEKRITMALKEYSLESETLSQAEEAICETAEKYSMRFLGDVLTGIYTNCYDQPSVIAGICSSLERFDAKEVSPWGQSIIIGLINHKNDIVKERVISVIDNWGDVSLLPALRNIEISSIWMKEYIDGVIRYLEDKLCII